MILTTHQQKSITLTSEIGKGGEAKVYEVAQHPNLVAKIYHKPTKKRESKLRAMLVESPQQLDNRITMAWPMALLYDEAKFVGYTMPKVSDSVSIFNVYNPIMRRSLTYPFNWQAIHRTAYNLTLALDNIHIAGHIVGDINESNILVNSNALVTLIDTDSFQIKGQDKQIYRCAVGKPEYTPPELHGVQLHQTNQTIEHDLFRLSILLFQLLMNGFHPFTGIIPTTKSIGRVDLYAIRQGIFPFISQANSSPPPHAPPFSILHPNLQATFCRCFVDGHQKPELRPTTKEWLNVLKISEQNLRQCSTNQHHIYTNHLNECPWCPPKPKTQEQLHINPIYKMGIEAYLKRDAEAVRSTMLEAFQVEPAPPSKIYAYLSWAYRQLGHDQAATVCCNKALAANPNDALANYNLGILRNKHKRHNLAIISFSQIINSDKPSEFLKQSLYQRATAYQLTKQFTKAQNDLEHYLQLEDKPSWRTKTIEKLQRLKNLQYTTSSQSNSKQTLFHHLKDWLQNL